MTESELLAIIKRAETKEWTKLDLNGRKIKRLPAAINRLKQLKTLNLVNNYLTNLPDELSQLTNLQHLYLSYNNLNYLPDWIVQLTNLQSLYLSGLNLDRLPDWITELTNLQRLDLMDNNLSTLPNSIVQFANLQYLNLDGNAFSRLPDWIVKLPQLQELYLYGNPIVEPSREVLGDALTKSSTSANIEGLRRYYAQLREAGTAVFYEAKLLIIGEGGAGKTSLAQKLINPTIPLAADEVSTEGIDILTWQFNLPQGYGQDLYNVNIWDFGGQEVYFATHQFFLTKRSIYVLVTDTRQQHTDFYTWLRMQETFGDDSPVLLLKNHNRKHGNRFTIENFSQLQARFPNLSKQVFEIDLSHVPKEATWSQLVRELEHRFLGLEHVGQPRPSTWVRVRKVLQTDKRDTVSREAFLELCYAQGIQREADALQLADYLHHLGEILFFQDDPILGDIVILKPTWGLDAVYRVLDNPAIVDNWGQFTLTDLRNLWHEPYYAHHRHQLLRLMQKFQLCYPLPSHEDTFIAPQLLEEKVPTYEWDNHNNKLLRYHYPVFMPRGILSRTIVKLYKRIENQNLVWRAGVILKDDYARAELLELRGEKEIRIRLSGRNQRDLLMEIIRTLDDLHFAFPKLRYQKLIPCNCASCVKRDEPHFFDLEDVRKRLAYGKKTIECNKEPFAAVSVRILLDDAMGIDDYKARQWHKHLVTHFNESEVQTLCYNLGIDYEVLKGNNKTDKARELVQYLNRRDDIMRLEEEVARQRPDSIRWV